MCSAVLTGEDQVGHIHLSTAMVKEYLVGGECWIMFV